MTLTSKPDSLKAALLVLLGLLVSGCATQEGSDSTDASGFLLGLFHGFTILFALVGSLFTDYRIYAYPNDGFFYDLGFLIGAMMFLGSGGAGAGSKRSRQNSPERCTNHGEGAG